MQGSLRIETTIRELTTQGEWAASAAPPVWRLPWRLGVPLPPLHFMAFRQVAVFVGAGMALCSGLLAPPFAVEGAAVVALRSAATTSAYLLAADGCRDDAQSREGRA